MKKNNEIKSRKYYRNLTIIQKKTLRESIKYVTEKRRDQIASIEKLLINPIKDQIKLGEDLKKNMIPIEFYLKRNDNLSKHIQNCIGKLTGEN